MFVCVYCVMLSLFSRNVKPLDLSNEQNRKKSTTRTNHATNVNQNFSIPQDIFSNTIASRDATAAGKFKMLILVTRGVFSKIVSMCVCVSTVYNHHVRINLDCAVCAMYLSCLEKIANTTK